MRGAWQFVVIGAGGLGCPALLGLAAAGASQITIVDFDRIEASNLQRQVLYDVSMVGMAKADAAVLCLRRRHPTLDLTPRGIRLEPASVPAFIAACPKDCVVLECTDQPALKFATNDACLAAGVPLVVGAALGWTGQAMAVMAGHACYRCIYESPPPPDTLPTCDAAGVIGPAVGHVGAVMAALALQLAAGTPATAGRLLAIDSRDGRTSTLAPRPRASCSACRATPTLAEAAAPV